MVDDVRLKCILETRYTDCTNEEPALHQAVISNDSEVLKLLIKCGIDISIVDKHGKLPIAYVLEESQLEILDLLLTAGSNIYELDELGGMQFSTAFRSGHENVIKKYFEYNINLNKTDSNGQTAIHYLMDNCCHDFEYYSKKFDLNLDVEDLNGQTPLLLAIKNENLDWVKLLLNKGIYIDYVFERQSTPFHAMIRYISGDSSAEYRPEEPSGKFTKQCMQLLIERGTDINKIFYGSYTILKLAYEFADVPAIMSSLNKLAIIEVSGSSIIEINRDIIDPCKAVYLYYQAARVKLKCLMELKLHPKVSYFNILIEENINTLAKYFRCVKSRKDFEKIFRNFDHYNMILRSKYIIAIKRAEEISIKEEMLSEIFYLNFPPHVIRKIAICCFSDIYKMPNFEYTYSLKKTV